MAAGLLPASAVAQDPNLVDQGRYDITIGDRAAGTETFAIRRQGDGYMSVGRLQIEQGSAWLRSGEFGLRTDGAFAPLRYETKSSDGGQGIRLTRAGTRIRVSNSTAEGERLTELLADPNQVLLDPGIAQHYYFFVRRVTAGATGSLKALLPGEAQEVPIRLVGTTDTEVQAAGSRQPARRYEFTVGGATHLVWADPADGRILRVEVPDRQWRSVRRAEN
ncbi:MAG: hypothetical protein ACR2GQ_10570 [Gemmatimonadota bacterium]